MNDSEREGVYSVGKRILLAAVAGWLLLFAGVLLSALVFHIFYLPEAAIPWVSGILTYISGFFCGFRSAKGTRRKGYRSGLYAGVVFVIGYAVITLIYAGQFRPIQTVILLILSVFGGIIGINATKTKRR